MVNTGCRDMSADNQALLDFIDAVKSQGASDEFVVALLRQNGWSEKRVYQAFGAWYEARSGSAIPSGGGRIEAAKDMFLYLLAFITLGIWTIELSTILFTAIDRIFPNGSMDYRNAAWMTREMSNALAGVIVAFPLFLLVSRAVSRTVRRQPERAESPVRKWLTYIALVVTASVVIVDVVTFLAYLLRGDLDIRFVLKVFSVLVIAGGVFGYYFDSLHRDPLRSTYDRAFVIGAAVLVSLGVIVGFLQIGSPAGQRTVSEDARRLFDLSSLAQAVHGKWLTRGDREFTVPATIPDASIGVAGDARTTDPVSGRSYGYTPLGATAYRLCATFSLPSPADVPAPWRHKAGNHCFTVDARDDLGMVQRQW